MKTLIKTAVAAIIAVSAAASAAAQDYTNWNGIDPYGVPMVDQFGDIHYVDPYAYDSQVDAYGNVHSSYTGELEPNGIDMYDLTHAYPDTSTTADPYEWSEYDSSAYTSESSSSTSSTDWIWE